MTSPLTVRVVVPIFVMWSAATICSPDRLHAQVAPGSIIRGVLVDEQTRLPINAAALRLIRPDGNTVSTAFTDTLGRYLMVASAAGTYRVMAERIGYHSQPSRILQLSGRDTVTLDFRLPPNALTLDSVFVRVKPSPPLRVGEQLIHGRLLDDDTRQPIAQGEIQLLLENGRSVVTTLTNDQGLFRIVSPRPATYKLRAEHIGYRAAEQTGLHMMPGDTLRLDFFLSARAVLLAPILVTASAREVTNRYRLVGLQDFSRRMGQFARAGMGSFVLRDSLAAYERRGYDTKFVLTQRTLLTPVRCGTQRGLAPFTPRVDVYVDGNPVPMVESEIDFRYPLETLEAIEVYVHPSIPADFPVRGGVCKVIALWTRRS